MMEPIYTTVAVLSLTAGLSGAMLTLSPSASAKTLVTCGPGGAAYIVDIVPAGCRVLSAAAPPMQSGNAVEGSQLGFYFTASVPQQTDVKRVETIASSQMLFHY
jgi:hypothetical protein